MSQPLPPDDEDHLLRDALHAEVEGVEATHDLFERITTEASNARPWASRTMLVAAAVAALVVGVAGAVLVADDEPVDTINDPATTMPLPTVDELGEALSTLFPCAEGKTELSLFVEAERATVVREALEADGRAPDVDKASAADVAASLEGVPSDGVLPIALRATFANGDDATSVRSVVSDLPGVLVVTTTVCEEFEGVGTPLPKALAAYGILRPG